MAVVAGIDIGNATTEVVVVELTSAGVTPLAWDRAITRGGKGSERSLAGAAALVRRLCRRHGLRLDAAAVARLHPVRTDVELIAAPVVATGRLALVADHADTAGGVGAGFGRPVPWNTLDSVTDDCVALVPADVGYAAAAARLSGLLRDRPIRAVLLEADEAVLVANRLPVPVPVVDSVDLGTVRSAVRLGVEVAGPTGVLREVGDALRLAAAFGLSADERGDAAAICATIVRRPHAIVALRTERVVPEPRPQPSVTFADGSCADLPDAVERILAGRPGEVVAFGADRVHDLFAVDLAAVARGVLAPDQRRPVAVAALEHAPAHDPAEVLAQALGVEVRLGGSEAHAARVGALTTPGASPDTVVVDVGAGTTDVVAGHGAATAAGAGQLITVATAALLDTVRGAAEWIKRGPCAALERPQLMVGEDGRRTFLDVPAPPEAVGRLVVTGPAGPLPFGRGMSTAEWRIVRQALKRDVIGANLRRCLRALDVTPESVVVVGGPAGDDEALTAIADAVLGRAAIGRGDVGGVLGHRYAAAYGLAVQHTQNTV